MSYTGENPNTYKGYTMGWEKGRQLKGMTKSGTSLSFEYNAAGVKTKKTADGIVHNYYMNGMNILFETIECATTVDVLEYVYDHNGNAAGIKYNGDTYLYEKNLQGDVIRLLDIEGQVVVNYVYDAWGKVEKITDANGVDLSSNPTHIANVNPIRYRSYYYDTETQLYYLQSRYYYPETGRFVNSDIIDLILIKENSFYNLYVYCNNNSVNFSDKYGYGYESVIKHIPKNQYLLLIFSAIALVMVLSPSIRKIIENIISFILDLIISFISLIQQALQAVMKKVKNKKRSGKIEMHHIVAKKAWAAAGSRAVLYLSGLTPDFSLNIVPVAYEVHRRLHTTAYHLGVTAVLLGMKATMTQIPLIITNIISLISLGMVLTVL